MKNYKITLNVNNSLPVNVQYQIEIDPFFLSPIDNSEIIFIGSRKGPSLHVEEYFYHTPFPSTPSPLPDEMFNRLLQIANNSERHLCSIDERESEEFINSRSLVELCGTTLRIIPPENIADAPDLYYPKDGNIFFCGGDQIDNSSKDPRCSTVPETCQRGPYALCLNN